VESKIITKIQTERDQAWTQIQTKRFSSIIKFHHTKSKAVTLRAPCKQSGAQPARLFARQPNQSYPLFTKIIKRRTAAVIADLSEDKAAERFARASATKGASAAALCQRVEGRAPYIMRGLSGACIGVCVCLFCTRTPPEHEYCILDYSFNLPSPASLNTPGPALYVRGAAMYYSSKGRARAGREAAAAGKRRKTPNK